MNAQPSANVPIEHEDVRAQIVGEFSNSKLASQFLPVWAETIASSTLNRRLIATIPVTKYIKDELDSGGDAHFFEDSVDVVPDGMFLHLKPLGDFAVLHAVGDKADHIFFATRQQGYSLRII